MNIDSEKLTHIKEHLEETLPEEGEINFSFLEYERLMGGGGLNEQATYIKLGIIEIINTLISEAEQSEPYGGSD